MRRKVCQECGSTNIQMEGIGKDEYGEYVDYSCLECGSISRIGEDD